MDPDSFMTIYGTFRRGDRPALGFQASSLARPPSSLRKEIKQVGSFCPPTINARAPALFFFTPISPVGLRPRGAGQLSEVWRFGNSPVLASLSI
ncbi:unnamed protein product [Leptosia nina]|uniref:Uncharacterized protein n=1 Tax=Leptosia nina TaxID=320188 RepID=A0AAV1J6Q4_9NEOP